MKCNLTQGNRTKRLYDQWFSVHFSYKGGTYEPTIVCYNKHDRIIEVRTERQTVMTQLANEVAFALGRSYITTLGQTADHQLWYTCQYIHVLPVIIIFWHNVSYNSI